MDGFPFRSFSFFSIISTSVEVRLPSFKRMNDHLSTTSPNDEEKRFEEKRALAEKRRQLKWMESMECEV